jgi:pimeloyl-ACP methyl ester carboxylesterase
VADAPAVHYTESGDASIAYTVEGSGPVDLLFVSGFVSHLDIVRSHPAGARFFDRLASFARLIRFDKRGQGLSGPGRYTLEDVVADALAVLDAVGVQRASLFGVSEGGSAATMLAATHPERIEAMVQYGTWARMSAAPDYPPGISLDRMDEIWGRIIDNWGTEELLDLFAPSMAADPEARDWWARLVRAGASPSTARIMGDMYRGSDVRALLPSVAVPSLILWRSDDLIVPPGQSRAVAAGIPGARGLELRGTDHLFVAGDQDEMLDPVEEFLTGRPPSRQSERILTTVLFVDIVDSTTRAAAVGDHDWRGLLDRFAEAARTAVTRQRGRVVNSTGDGLLATFDGPTHAALAALEIRRRAEAIRLDIRAGIHTGECEVIGEDIGGIAVHIASRIESEADPGEVLASRTAKDLSIGSGLGFADRGVRRLRGVPDDWALFAVEPG